VTSGRSALNLSNLRRGLPRGAPVFLLAAAAILLLAGIIVSEEGRPDDPPASRPLPERAFALERTQPGPAPTHRLVNVVDREAARPRRISIPAIGVSARVVPLGLAADRTMETPGNFAETGWFEPGREPGERGPAVVVGHVDSTGGPAVFYRLRELRRGNRINIRRADGSVVRFRVEGLERWPKAAFPTRRVFGHTGVAALRLVTCSGNFDPSTGHYVDNTIVYAARVRVRR
jgi:sortase (surface protein transpeptidase)